MREPRRMQTPNSRIWQEPRDFHQMRHFQSRRDGKLFQNSRRTIRKVGHRHQQRWNIGRCQLGERAARQFGEDVVYAHKFVSCANLYMLI